VLNVKIHLTKDDIALNDIVLVILESSDPLAVKKTIFVDKMVKRYPPCFSEWFLNNFHDPQAW